MSATAASAAYLGATEGMAVFERSDRALLSVAGKAPAQMLSGILTGVIPGPPTVVEGDVHGGTATYHAVLTPKGKMISDLWALLLGDEEAIGFLLDVPSAGHEGLAAHLAKFLPPRFARVRELGAERASLGVVGPKAAAALSKLALGLRVDPEWLERCAEGEWRCAGSPASGLVVARTEDVWPLAWIVYGPAEPVAALHRALVGEGAIEGDSEAWTTLRVEAGRPAFGPDMDHETLPPEAGIVDRAIDHGKGCYTGQEVIVRIRDRGHVNRELRRLALGEATLPEPGTELRAADGSGKVVGTVTSSVHSPRAGGVLALARVRREAESVLLGDSRIDVPLGFPEPLAR
ncbi:MAG: hypothetical protein OEN56_00795 [Gemmatimonadota bacterium]|nr:hypothetical protein [Gemmatimonadota bacterium]